MAIHVTPLGAGRHVGRSCLLLEVAGCRVLLDCGVHAGSSGEAHAPEFGRLTKDGGSVADAIDVVVVSHFHLDHAGALPHLTEVLGFRGPVLMTHPTRAIAPIILRDYLRFERPTERPLYSPEQLEACFARVSCLQLQQRLEVGELAVTPYYAGHVLGAALLLLECRGRSVLYTGDFTTVPDHHLGAAKLPLALAPEAMITESTYCTTVRSSKRAREQELCRKIQDTLDMGGKVLMPSFMIGRAQELCLLCEKHWEREGLNYPIYIIRGMADKALGFFRLFASWASERLRKMEDPFQFPHVRTVDLEEVLNSNSPMVIFAGNSMMNGGPSLQIFKRWAPDGRNLVLFAGYCLPGTIGNEVQAKRHQIVLDEDTTIKVACGVETHSHSDHADSRGILQLIAQTAPKHVVLVHGQEHVMRVFKRIVEKRLRVACSDPEVGERATVDNTGSPAAEVRTSSALLAGANVVPAPPGPFGGAVVRSAAPSPYAATFRGLLVRRKRGAEESLELLECSAAGVAQAGLRAHRVRFRHASPSLPWSSLRAAWAALAPVLRSGGVGHRWRPSEPPALSGDDGQDQVVGARDGGWELSLLSATRCCLGAGPKPGHARATLEWTREDRSASASVSRFLEALGAS